MSRHRDGRAVKGDPHRPVSHGAVVGAIRHLAGGGVSLPPFLAGILLDHLTQLCPLCARAVEEERKHPVASSDRGGNGLHPRAEEGHHAPSTPHPRRRNPPTALRE